ncbi:MAG: NACHT domain-containing protein [Chloroflexota bacterium]
MRYLPAFLAVLAISTIATAAFFVVRVLDPESTSTPYLTVALIVGAVLGAGAFLSALQDATQLFERMLNTSGSGSGRQYRKKYLEYMFFRHRNFDVKGLTTQGVYTLELSRVFVELSVVPRQGQKMSNSPLPVPKELQKGSHSIWSYLKFNKKESPNFAIIGVPGSGKTTMLKHMTLAMIGKVQGLSHDAPKKLPVLLYLRDHTHYIAEDREHLYSLEDAIQKDLRKWDKVAPKGWFTKELNNGNCVVMLDGLDEVADPVVRLKVVEWVDRQLVAYPKNSFIVTSRPHGYRNNPLGAVTILEIRPFTSKQQIEFVQNWYFANEIQSQQKDDEGVRIDAKEGADDLLKRLYHTSKLAELAVNPLLLTMIATVHKYRSSLPSRRVELYSEICEVFLGRRQLSKGLQLDLTPEQRKRVLQPLAWHMMKNELREVTRLEAQHIIEPTLKSVQHYASPEVFLKNIENDSGLLVERENGICSFAHLTFQEFLAAEHVRDQSSLLESLLSHVKESWWHETLLLYAARADATPIVEACIDAQNTEDASPLLLAVACLEEAREVTPEAQIRLEKVLEESLDGKDRQRIGLLARIRLEQRVKNLIRVIDDQAVDVSLVTNAEYQLFIDESISQGQNYTPPHWQNNFYQFGTGGAPVLGITVRDVLAFCEWLTESMEDGFRYLLPKKGETMHIPMKTSPEIDYAGYWVEKDTNNYSVEMFKGQYPKLSFQIFDGYRKRVLAAGLQLDYARTAARKKDIDLNLMLGRYVAAASSLNLRIAKSDLGVTAFPDRHLIAQAKELNQKAIKRELNPDLYLSQAFIKELESQFNHDSNRDLALLLLLAGLFLSRLRLEDDNLSWAAKNRQDYKKWVTFAMKLIQDYTTAFVNLCMIEERKKNRLLPYEGIRLMRERKPTRSQELP